MKKQKISRPAKVFCFLFVVVMLFSMMTMASANSANNYFVQTGNFADGVYTPAARKDTSSYIVASNNSSTCPIYSVAVFGSRSSSGIGEDVTYGVYQNIPTNSSRALANLVYERDYTYARLRLWTSTTATMTMNVTWVADI